MTTGQKIKQLRKEKGLTQKDLGKLIGMSYQQIGQYENGKRKPKTETLRKIANALEVPISELDDSLSFDNMLLDLFAGSPKFDEIIDKKPSVSYALENKHRERLEYYNHAINVKHEKMQPGDEMILSYFHEANDLGKDKIIDYASDIVENPKYRKDTTEE